MCVVFAHLGGGSVRRLRFVYKPAWLGSRQRGRIVLGSGYYVSTFLRSAFYVLAFFVRLLGPGCVSRRARNRMESNL